MSDTVLGAGDAGLKQARGEQPVNPSLSEIGKIRITGHTGARGPGHTPPPLNMLIGWINTFLEMLAGSAILFSREKPGTLCLLRAT